MSVVSASRTQRRDKSASNTQKQSQITAEDIRLAQIISNNNCEEDTELSRNVAKVIEVTGTTEDIARIALYDTNSDTNRAIELILESGSFEQTNEWETAGRKKNKSIQNSVRGVDTFDEEIKEDVSTQYGNRERSTSRGRGRGRSSKNRSKNNEPHRPPVDDGQQNFESRERTQGGRRGRGRGRGGRMRGGLPRRFARYNQNRDEGKDDFSYRNSQNEYSRTYGNFTNSSNATETWNDEKDWGGLEVGTWSNEDTQKQSEKKTDLLNEPWGTESWTDDLRETQVFQSQTTLLNASVSGSMPLVQNHMSPPATGPQMGERIDLGALFKKNQTESGNTYNQQIANDGLRSQSGMIFNNSSSSQHSAPSVIQQLQQQGQSNSLFSDSKTVNDMESQTSRLFGAYDSSSAKKSSDIGHYNSLSNETVYSQYNGKLMHDNADGNSSTLLGSFVEQFETADQNSMLGQISDLTESAFTPLKQGESQGVPSSGSNYRNFSQAQQREATEAVKASLGLPSTNSEQIESSFDQSGSPGLLSNEPLSFGAPQPVRMQKQPRKKTPTGASKIPASAVEMPGVAGTGYHELPNFDLQFGVDDTTSASTALAAGLPASQGSLFHNSCSAVPSTTPMINHVAPGNIDNSSIFSSKLPNQTLQPQSRTPAESNLQTTDTSTSSSLQAQQRFSESMKPSESLRGPPGIAHPQALSLSTSSGNGLGTLTGNNQPSCDLPSSGGAYASGRLVGKLPLTSLSHESTQDSSQNIGKHVFYTSASRAHQSQQHIVSDHTSSAGRNMRSPVPTTNLPGSIQASPMAHMPGTQSSPMPHMNASASTSMSSLTSNLAHSHITPHGGGTPAKTSASPTSLLGSSASGTSLGGNGGFSPINMAYSTSSVSTQPTSASIAASPGKHPSNTELYPSAGLPSSLHHQQLTAVITSNSLGSPLENSILPSLTTDATKSSLANSMSKAGPPNLTLGVPPLLTNQYGIPMGAGLMTAYTPEALYGYTDPLVAVQSRVHQMPNYYDMYSMSNPANTSPLNRDSNSTSTSQGKFGRGEPSSPTPLMGAVNSASTALAQQQLPTGQHNAQLKVSQTGSHQAAQPFMNLPAAAPAAYPGFGSLYYNAFQYPPMFAAATAVPGAKHPANTTAAFQQPAAASLNVSSASNLHDLQGQGYSKNHMTLTAAMAAANTAAGPGLNPYTQAPFMTMLPTHQHSQIHLHLPQHGDVGQTVASQRSQASNPMGKTAAKAPFGSTATPYWGN